VVEFGEWLCEQVIKAVPHRHFIFSIPKILRRYFLYNRGLLSELTRCGWESLKAFFQEAVPEEDAVPGAVIAIQSFGDFLVFNPHLHVLISDGCFYGNGMFRPALARLIGFKTGNAIFGSLNDPLLMSRITRSGPGVAPRFHTKPLEEIFRHKVFKVLLSKGKITQDLVNMLMSWRHSGFNVFCGPRIQPGHGRAMENLARYIIRASFSQESPPCDLFIFKV